VALEVPASASPGGPTSGSGLAFGLAPPDEEAAPTDQSVPGGTARAKVTRVVSADVSVWQRMADIWRSRELLTYLVRTEIKVKYKNSILGLVWSMISPAMTLAIYFIVFQFIAKNGVPHFVIFLFSGLLVWNLFQVGVQTGTGVVVNNAGLVKKVSFPREILALASMGSASVFFVFQAVVMVIFMVVLHSSPAWDYLPLIPLALLAVLVLGSGLAVLLSAVNVYLRDTQHLVEVLMTAWFWACPIVYAFQNNIGAKLGPRGLTWLYFLNPLTPLVLSFQRALYAHVVVQNTVSHTALKVLPAHGFAWYAGLDAGVLGLGVVLFVVALAIFGRLEGNFAEEL
jgi:ABC-2 type transport system permease protein